MLEKEGFEVHNAENIDPVLQEAFQQETRQSTKEGKSENVTTQQAGLAMEMVSGKPFEEVLGEIDKEIGKYDSKSFESTISEASMEKENHVGQPNINDAKVPCMSSKPANLSFSPREPLAEIPNPIVSHGWSKVEIEGICRDFGYTSVSRLWYKMSSMNQERANFHLVVDDHDAMFMKNLVRGHEEIHVYVEHPVDDLILVDEGEDIGENVQPLAMEQDLIVYYDGEGSEHDDHDNHDESEFYSFYDSDDMYANYDIDNNEDEPIEVDVEQVYSRKVGERPIIEEVNEDDTIKVDASQVYSRKVSKEHIIERPSEDFHVSDSSESGGSDLEDEAEVNPD
nr:hypothetical protein CFP56_23664 [Quercus suber]